MKPQKSTGIDLDYLRRCKALKPEQRLEWLAAAVAFAQAARKQSSMKTKA